MSQCFAMVKPVSARDLSDAERRAAVRHPGTGGGMSRPPEKQIGIWWGTEVRDLSDTGIGLSSCYPFRAGTILAVELQSPMGKRSVLARVVHVRDQAHGTFHIGCELVNGE